ncbi:MAG: efflux RND transporter periplasmic adaptor subunit [Nitrospirae bacterium]|nr:efflux RND transporter periplasmic adaptor subunit [Nitrospirota bacterium]
MINKSVVRIVVCISFVWTFLFSPMPGPAGSAIDGLVVQSVFAQHAGHGGAPPAQPEPARKQAKEQPKEQQEAVEAPTVEIPLDKQQMMGLKTAPVARKALRKTIRTVGRIEVDERRFATVTTKFEGWIEKLYVDFTGKHVKKGEPLAEIYSPELFATQQEFINTLRWKTQGGAIRDDEVGRMYARDNETIIEAARQRLRFLDISDEQIREIEATGKALRTLKLNSPVDGTVIQKTAVLGTRVMPGEKLFDIADLSTVWVVAELYESDLSLVREGETAKIRMGSSPGKVLSARVEYVSPTLSEETRTAQVRFSLPNPDGRLKPKMFTDLELEVNMGTRLVVPEDSVINTGERQIVYVDKGEGNFEPRLVTVGIVSDGMAEVLSGLKLNERVAASANFLIDSEARLKGIVK